MITFVIFIKMIIYCKGPRPNSFRARTSYALLTHTVNALIEEDATDVFSTLL